MKITIKNTITGEVNENPTLLFENGQFVLTMEEVPEGTYVARHWLDIYEISNNLEEAYMSAVWDYETAVIEIYKLKEEIEELKKSQMSKEMYKWLQLIKGENNE